MFDVMIGHFWASDKQSRVKIGELSSEVFSFPLFGVHFPCSDVVAVSRARDPVVELG